MKITLLTQYYLPQPLANAEVIGGLTRELGTRGHEITVVSPVANATSGPGIRHRRAFGTFARDRGSISARLLEYATFSIGALIAGCRGPRTDVVIVPSPPLTLGLVGAAVASRHRAPLVYNVQDLYPEVVDAIGDTPSSLRRVLKVLARFVYRRSAAVVVIDSSFVPIIERAHSNAIVRAIPNGIDIAPFAGAQRDDSWLRAIGVPTGTPVAMYAGNVGRSQDLLAAIEATRHLGVAFVVHGAGAGLDDLRSHVAAQGYEHVHFSNYVERAQLGAIFASADLHVAPLKPGVAWASVPSKLLSIFSAGRPVVLAAEDGSPAAAVVREAGGGWVVPPGQPDQLADAVAAAFADRAALVEAGRRAGEWAAANASDAKMADKWAALLLAIVEGRPR